MGDLPYRVRLSPEGARLRTIGNPAGPAQLREEIILSARPSSLERMIAVTSRITGNPEVIGSSVGHIRQTRYWLEDRGQDHAFRRGSGGRFQWRRANANESRKRSSNYPI